MKIVHETFGFIGGYFLKVNIITISFPMLKKTISLIISQNNITNKLVL